MSKEKIENLTKILNSAQNLKTDYLEELQKKVNEQFGTEEKSLDSIKNLHSTEGKDEMLNTGEKFNLIIEKLNELCFLAEQTLSEINVEKDEINDLDKVLNNLVNISKVSKDLNNGLLQCS